jgi:hypothetical protein
LKTSIDFWEHSLLGSSKSELWRSCVSVVIIALLDYDLALGTSVYDNGKYKKRPSLRGERRALMGLKGRWY